MLFSQESADRIVNMNKQFGNSFANCREKHAAGMSHTASKSWYISVNDGGRPTPLKWPSHWEGSTPSMKCEVRIPSISKAFASEDVPVLLNPTPTTRIVFLLRPVGIQMLLYRCHLHPWATE